MLINWCLQWASFGFGLNAYRLPSIYLFTCILYVVGWLIPSIFTGLRQIFLVFLDFVGFMWSCGLLNVFFCSVMDIVAFFLHPMNVSLEHRLFSIVVFFSE